MGSLMGSIQDRWKQKDVSIFEHVKTHVCPGGPGLLPGGERLPDDDEYQPGKEIGLEPGAFDILSGTPGSMPPDVLEKRVQAFIDAILLLGEKPSARSMEALELLMRTRDTLPLIDRVIGRIISTPGIDQGTLYRTCRQFFLTSRRRGVVKFCLSIMGLYAVPEDIPLFKTIARHEEFTLYATVAIIFPRIDPVPHWLEMARNVTGWGRIHLVKRLAEHNGPQVKDFLLKEGCRNSIMEEYTARETAQAVGLAEVLQAGELDPGSFRGAGVMLRAMADSPGEKGLFEGLNLYPAAAGAAAAYVRHASRMASTPADFLAVEALVRVALSQAGEEIFKEKKDARQTVIEMGGEILKRENWDGAIIQDIGSACPFTRRWAIMAAGRRGMALTGRLIELLDADPLQETLWFALWKGARRESADRIIGFIEEKMDPQYLQSRCRSTLNLDIERQFYSCLGWSIRGLISHPGRGGRALKAALESPFALNRCQAIRVLHAWPAATPPPEGVEDAVRKLAGDPGEAVQTGAENLLKKWSAKA
jgi:hypothetical protein